MECFSSVAQIQLGHSRDCHEEIDHKSTKLVHDSSHTL